MPLRRLLLGGPAGAAELIVGCVLLAAAVGALLASSAQAFRIPAAGAPHQPGASAFTPTRRAAAGVAVSAWQRLPSAAARAQRTRLYSLPRDYYERLGVTRWVERAYLCHMPCARSRGGRATFVLTHAPA